MLFFLSFSAFARGQRGAGLNGVEGWRASAESDRTAARDMKAHPPPQPLLITWDGQKNSLSRSANVSPSANGDSARNKNLTTDSPLPSQVPQTKEKPFRLNLKVVGTILPAAGTAGALLEFETPFLTTAGNFNWLIQAGGAVLATFSGGGNIGIAATWLEFETPFLTTVGNFNWLIQAGGAAYFKRWGKTSFIKENITGSSYYISAHTGLKQNFEAWSASLTTGLFYLSYMEEKIYPSLVPSLVVSAALPVFPTLVSAHIGFSGFLEDLPPIFPTHFLFSVTVPLTL